MVGGVPSFADRDFYWGEVPRDLMAQVNEYANAHGWEAAVDKLVRPDHGPMIEYIAAAGRIDWALFSSINATSSDRESLT